MGVGRRRSVPSLVVAVAASLGLGACQLATSTPAVIYVTPPPTPLVIYVTPEPTPMVVYVTPSPGTTPEETATPESADTAQAPAPTPAPISPAAFCSGNANNRAFFVEAARGVKFTVYCATGLPAGWAVYEGQWQGTKSGGLVFVTYRYRSANVSFVVEEGAFCPYTVALQCLPSNPLQLGPANFGGLPATLWTTGSNLWVSVAPGTNHAYLMAGNNVSQATLKSFAANMKAVPKT